MYAVSQTGSAVRQFLLPSGMDLDDTITATLETSSLITCQDGASYALS